MREQLASLRSELAATAEVRWPRAYAAFQRYGFAGACIGFGAVLAALVFLTPAPPKPQELSVEELRYLAQAQQAATLMTQGTDQQRPFSFSTDSLLSAYHEPDAAPIPPRRGPRRRARVMDDIPALEALPMHGAQARRPRTPQRLSPTEEEAASPAGELQPENAELPTQPLWTEPDEVRQQRILQYVAEARQQRQRDSVAVRPDSAQTAPEQAPGDAKGEEKRVRSW